MILKLKPVFKERIWGGSKLASKYNYNVDKSLKIGECWGISAHKEGANIIENEEFSNETLDSLFKKRKDLFNNYKGDQFPLLIKIIDAEDDLSVQVHPDNKYANKFENGSLGKSECWYILDVDENQDKICIGHNAKSKQEFINAIENDNLNSLLCYKSIKKDMMVAIPPGTVHAILKSTLIYEVQQSSDITYRLYDYNRVDSSGNKRELHIDKSLAVINFPHHDTLVASKIIKKDNSSEFTQLYSNEFFTVFKLEINSNNFVEIDFILPFMCVSVIEGEGVINNEIIKCGDHFIICKDNNLNINIKGKLIFIISVCN